MVARTREDGPATPTEQDVTEEGRGVSAVEAANLLRVSRPHLVRLLDKGEIPYRMIGSHRHIRREDVLAYKQRRHEQNLKLLDEMTALGQELGLYD